ncbi:hypothetical protein VP01_127g2 [Puccinia sorghi]|uniref:Uncharacterized protein n=1 Tax=Puccinia sorghi TaxID=27349 RepID=A0A0L6VNT4_9BASI|nr:hypothetical protein VP01_127g2 [Puccinia sorghi]
MTFSLVHGKGLTEAGGRFLFAASGSSLRLMMDPGGADASIYFGSCMLVHQNGNLCAGIRNYPPSNIFNALSANAEEVEYVVPLRDTERVYNSNTTRVSLVMDEMMVYLHTWSVARVLRRLYLEHIHGPMVVQNEKYRCPAVRGRCDPPTIKIIINVYCKLRAVLNPAGISRSEECCLLSLNIYLITGGTGDTRLQKKLKHQTIYLLPTLSDLTRVPAPFLTGDRDSDARELTSDGTVLPSTFDLSFYPSSCRIYYASRVRVSTRACPDFDSRNPLVDCCCPLMSPSLMKKSYTVDCPVFYYTGHHFCVTQISLLQWLFGFKKNSLNREKLCVSSASLSHFFFSLETVVVLDMDDGPVTSKSNKKKKKKQIKENLLEWKPKKMGGGLWLTNYMSEIIFEATINPNNKESLRAFQRLARRGKTNQTLQPLSLQSKLAQLPAVDMQLVFLLQPFYKIYICKQVEFGWQLGWSMLHVNCSQLSKVFLKCLMHESKKGQTEQNMS